MTLNFVYVAYGEAHVQMAMRSMETAVKHYPGALFILYTDRPQATRFIEMVRPAYFKNPFMLANVMCQTDWLALKTAHQGKTVFLDNDTVMMQPLPEMPKADLYVTWRDNVGDLSLSQPYNYGVVIANHSVDILRAFVWLEQRITKLSPQRQKWYGNQIALRELVGPLQKNETVHRNMGTFEIDVHQLPCHKWNWTPPDDKPKQNASDKVFVHLKGDRKELMDFYYNKVMGNGIEERTSTGS